MSLDWMRMTPAFAILSHAAFERPIEIDAARRILDHGGLEARLARIERRPGDAEVGREAGNVDRVDAARLQVRGEPGRRLAVGFA